MTRLGEGKGSIDSTMVKAIPRAFRWQKMLVTGRYATIKEIAKAEKINASCVSLVLRLTLLAPTTVEAISRRACQRGVDARGGDGAVSRQLVIAAAGIARSSHLHRAAIQHNLYKLVVDDLDGLVRSVGLKST